MKTALVTGAGRGVGKGIAVALAQAGYDVFATGRTIAAGDLPATIHRIPCDHGKDGETRAVFGQVGDRLDVLVNCTWGGYERMVESGAFTWSVPFWQQPDHRWMSMMQTGVRAAFVCSAKAAERMVPARQGLIVNIGFWAAQKYAGNAVSGIARAATDKMTSHTAHEPYELKAAPSSVKWMAGKFQVRMPGQGDWKSYPEWSGSKK